MGFWSKWVKREEPPPLTYVNRNGFIISNRNLTLEEIKQLRESWEKYHKEASMKAERDAPGDPEYFH